MKIQIEENSVNFEDLQSKLVGQFPQYEFNVRQRNFLVAKKSGTIGTNILLRKNKILVVGNFPSVGATIIFTLSVVLLGVIIPIIVYFAAFHTKMKALEKEIAEYIQKEIVGKSME